MPVPAIDETLEKIKSLSYYIGQIKSDFRLEGQDGRFSDFPDFLLASFPDINALFPWREWFENPIKLK